MATDNGTNAGKGEAKPKQVILRWDTNETLFGGEYDTLREAIEAAVAQQRSLYRASLDGARLDGARLDGARLDGASLVGASLVGARLVGARLDGARLDGARLDTGETFETYCTEVVPALCVAGGRTLAEVGAAWDCHQWENCPMHVAFNGAKSENDDRVPVLLRPRVKQFVKFFDAQLLKRELIPGLGSAPEACPTGGAA